MDYIEKLDNILLSYKAAADFFQAYEKKGFKSWINKLCPEIDKCVNQQQIHPYHIYDVMTHLLVSVEAMNSQTLGMDLNIRRMLAYVMFLHDIGKPECHRRTMKDGQVRDSFQGHQVVSARIASKILPKLNFTDSEVKIMTELIYKHDIFMFIKLFKTNNPYWRQLSPDVIKSEISELNEVGDGMTLMKYLIMIGRSDKLAQNPEMTADSTKLLNRMEKMLKDIEKEK